MIKYLVMVLFLSAQLYADTSWQKQVQSLLPPPLDKLQPLKTTLTDIEKLLGKAQLVEGQNYYWERDGLKYALKVSVNEKKQVSTLHYTFTGAPPSFEKLNKKIPIEKFSPYAKGRYLIYREKNSELIIDPVSKTIHSVQLP